MKESILRDVFAAFGRVIAWSATVLVLVLFLLLMLATSNVACAGELGRVPMVTLSPDGAHKLGSLRSADLRATSDWFPYLCLREKGKPVASCLVVLPKLGTVTFITVVIKEIET